LLLFLLLFRITNRINQETPEQNEQRLDNVRRRYQDNRQQINEARRIGNVDFINIAYRNPNNPYPDINELNIGDFNRICQYCNSVRLDQEDSYCCDRGSFI
jgi:hypothetical protein